MAAHAVSSRSNGRGLTGGRSACLGIAALFLVTTLAATVPAARANIDTSASAMQIANAIVVQGGGGALQGASFVALPPAGTPTAKSTTPLAGFPVQGPSYAILTTGDAALASAANSAPDSGADNGGASVRGDSDGDVVILKIDLEVPPGQNCLAFDFRFLSEEFPESDSGAPRDGFVAELDGSTWTTSGTTISAPDNFAFDPAGNVIGPAAVGADSLAAELASGTTYDGATPLLRAKAPITAGAHSLYLSIFDVLDRNVDSAAFLGNLRLTVADTTHPCLEGALPAVQLPGAPQGLLATAGAGAGDITLSWQAPADDGGSPITGYDVYRGDASGAETLLVALGTVQSFTDGLLGNGVTLYYQVAAVNSLGEGPRSNEAFATTFDLPGAPGPLSATAGPGAGEITLDWTAPATDGGTPITGYKVYRGDASGAEAEFVALGDVLTFTDSGLNSGATLFYQVTAINLVGESLRSNEASTGTFDLPSAPLGLAATRGPGVGEITLDWSAPTSDGGTPVTGYKVFRGGASGQESELATLGTGVSFTDGSLGNGATFFYQVAAVNAVGDGLRSNEAVATTFDVPGAPVDAAAATGPGVGQITISWNPPEQDGGFAVAHYALYRGSSSGSLSLLTSMIAGLQYTDGGLANGVTLFYQVSAVNDAGEGARSLEVSATTLRAPSAPQGAVARAGPDAAQISLSWQTPLSQGDGPITEYRVYGAEINDPLVLEGVFGPEAFSFVDSDLAPGVVHLFQVTAVNDVGEGPPSNQASAAAFTQEVEATLPSGRMATAAIWQGHYAYIVGGLEGTADNGDNLNEINRYNPQTDEMVTLDVTLPTPLHGASASWMAGVTGEPVASAGDVGAQGCHPFCGPGSVFVVGGATESVLRSADDSSAQDQACGVGCALQRFDPTSLDLHTYASVLPSARAFTSNVWTGQYAFIFGGTDGTNALDEIVRFDPNADALVVLESRLPSARWGTSAVWTGQVALIFGGADAAGVPTDEVVEFNPLTGSVQVVGALPSARLLTSAAWTGTKAFIFGGSDGTNPLADIVGFDPVLSELQVVGSLPEGKSATSVVWTGSDAYVFGGDNGQSGTDTIIRFTPSAPVNPAAVPGAGRGEVTVSWSDPALEGSSPVTSFRVWRGLVSGGEALLQTVPVGTNSIVDSGLADATTYYYKVSALNDVGESPQSIEVSATTFDLPGAASDLVADTGPKAKQITLRWVAPAASGGTPVTNYQIYRGTESGQETLVATVGDQLTYADSNLGPGQYFYQVAAVNLVGAGPASNEADALALPIVCHADVGPPSVTVEVGCDVGI